MSRLTEGVNGLSMVHLVCGSSTADIYLLGGTVTSWRYNGEEKLFVSSQAIYNGVKAIRGGIPLVFPQFSQPLKEMPQHGFTRTSKLDLQDIVSSETSSQVIFTLTHNDSTLAVWPHKFQLFYVVTLSSDSLTSKLTIVNVDKEPFKCHTLLHSYLSVPHISSISVKGFKGYTYIDKLTNSSIEEPEEECEVNQEVDRVVLAQIDKPLSPVTVIDRVTKTPLIEVNTICTYNNQPIPFDVVFWNPWIEKAKALADLGDEDYLKYVCIEPGTVSNWVDVDSDGVLVLQQTLRVI